MVEDKRIEDAVSVALLHLDFNMRNIYVSAKGPKVITGMVDWQSTSIGHAIFMPTKQLISPRSLSSFEKDLLENEESEQEVYGHKEREWKDASICY